jgi:DNA-binding NarL/FixJ family response regulator
MRILLIDDHPIFRAGLESLLRQMDPEVQVFHAATCAEGLEVATREPLNLAFLDLNLPDADGLTCLIDMKQARPSLPVVVVSGEGLDRAMMNRLLDAKAMGFVPKSERTDMLFAALQSALAGGVFLPATQVEAAASGNGSAGFGRRRLSATLPEELGLTPRQADVLRFLVQGLPNKRIATLLGISVPVVKKHVSDLLAHFRVVSRTQLVAQIAERRVHFGPPDISDPNDEITDEDD